MGEQLSSFRYPSQQENDKFHLFSNATLYCAAAQNAARQSWQGNGDLTAF
jgi:hypothetical protein